MGAFQNGAVNLLRRYSHLIESTAGSDPRPPPSPLNIPCNFPLTSLHVLGALRLRRLTSSRVICGPVRGPIYVEACKDCVIVAAGRQVRVLSK